MAIKYKLTKLKHIRLVAVIIVSVITTSLYLCQPGFIKNIFLNIEDTKFSIRADLGLEPKPHKGIVVIEVDEKSINKLGRWPWDRKVIGDLITNMREAELVALDIIFPEEANKEEDNYLADKIADNNNVILGFFFREKATEHISEDALFTLEDCAVTDYEVIDEEIGLEEYPYAEVNIPDIAIAGMSCAFFNNKPDSDGILRRYPVASIFKGNIFVPIAVQMARHHLNQDANIILDQRGVKSFSLGTLQHSNHNYFRLNYYNEKEINRISAYDALNIDPSFFKDKMAIIGTTEMGIYDIRPTPIDPFTPGVYLHYTSLSNILNNEFLVNSKLADILISIFVIFLTSALTTISKKVLNRVAIYTGLLLSVIFVVNYLFIYNNYWLSLSFPILGITLSALLFEIFSFFQAEVKSAEVKKAFSSYVSPDLVQSIINNPDSLKLGGEEREISILFSDIRGFTTLSEQLSPSQVVYLLNNYLEPATRIITNNKGLLDKYIGDAIMALFNTPIYIDNHADAACDSALKMMQELPELNRRFRDEGIPEVDVGIGINTGIATVGNMGSSFRFDYTAIGDAVNLSSRLEGLNKMYKTHIIISEFTKKQLKGDYLLRKLDNVAVKGKKIPIKIFELMEENENNRKIKESFEAGLTLYCKMQFEEAIKVFEAISGDPTAGIFAERCVYYLGTPPDEEWNEVYKMKSK